MTDLLVKRYKTRFIIMPEHVECNTPMVGVELVLSELDGQLRTVYLKHTPEFGALPCARW